VQDSALPWLFLVAVALLLWLLLIRPAQRRNRDRNRELTDLQSTLEVGDEVMLTSGVYGVLRSIDESDVQVEVAAGVVIKVARGAVGQIVTPPQADDSEVSEEKN
jgi:preprotein translocase subunit YajC